MAPIDDQKAVEILARATARWQQMPPLPVLLTPYEGWVVLSTIHLCLRHPLLPAGIRETLTGVGRRLQPLVCDTPELDALAERGWDPANDRPADPPTARTRRAR